MKNLIIFYRKINGFSPAEEFINGLPEKHKAKALREIDLLQEYGSNLKQPYADRVTGARYQGLWELRIKFASDISRIFYFIPEGKVFILLHGFVKKSKKTPEKELETALRYMKECRGRIDNEL